jgi:alkyl sulfatase BDS1-like metallo-beta-lactamase superfamily hydrolase
VSYSSKDASPATAAINQVATALYDMDDRQDFEDARRGLVAPIPDGRLVGEDGHVLPDLSEFAYLTDATRPDTVNPSLWRQSRVMHEGGLYKVVDRLYQVRNNDIGDLTIVDGDDGL